MAAMNAELARRGDAQGDPTAPPADRIVEVAVPRPLRHTFDYVLPADAATPATGARVRVPFAGASVVGVVTGNRRGSSQELKVVDDVLDDNGLLPADIMALCRWLATYYHHPIGDVFATVLPSLARRGAAAATSEEFTWRAIAEEEAPTALKRASRQRQTWQRLLQCGAAADGDLAALGIDRESLKRLLAKQLVTRTLGAPSRHPQPPAGDPTEMRLTEAQAAALRDITAMLGNRGTLLLDGVTGSGKTEVYLRAIAEVLRRGGQALVLVPEIALTPQTVLRFQQRFGAAATLHSAVADRQRFDTWLKCANGTHKVLIGTRSAVFTPLAKPGIIIVDEEHDDSFKQSRGLHYSARDVAVKRGGMLSIPVVLGSATPSLRSLENARRKRYRHARLPERPGKAAMPAFRIIDARGLRLDRGFSQPLLGAVDRHLAAGNQVLVFINRRGYAPILLCTQCGWQAECAHCAARLIVHRQRGAWPQLRCHQCDRRRPLPKRCPDCGGDTLLPIGTGTQRAEEALAERFPQVPLYRIDRDAIRSQQRLEARLAAVRKGAPAILIGTQMLAKGHHFPNVTLVAVLGADTGFLAADFRAPERTAALIVQVAGRAGRAERPGEVWLQTLDPANANLQALINSGYAGFAANERAIRQAANLPPFSALAVIRAQGRDEAATEGLLATALKLLHCEGVEVLGPAPAPVPLRSDLYRYQLLLIASRRADLHRALANLASKPPRTSGVRWSIDVDPMDTS